MFADQHIQHHEFAYGGSWSVSYLRRCATHGRSIASAGPPSTIDPIETDQ